jgi:drug/metabolite transporter (DMT)-like permease
VAERTPITAVATRPSTAILVAAFAAVWIIWGSTYLAIRYTLETLPPFAMAGARFLLAGVLLYGFARLRGAPRPRAVQWRSALILGTLMFMIGNGSVVWAEQHIASGPAALLIATEPLLVMLLQGLIPRGLHLFGLMLGFAGVVILVGPAALAGEGAIDPLAAIAIVIGSLSWAAGSLYGRRANLPSSMFQSAGMQMLMGGAVMFAVGALTGDLARFDVGAVSARSLGAFFYLVVFGSIIAFTAYGLLVRHVSPARVATYAFVNPVVAVVLGSTLADEPFSPRLALAAAVIIAGVVLISLAAPVPTPEPKASGSDDRAVDDAGDDSQEAQAA